jgi:hypothetical protein
MQRNMLEPVTLKGRSGRIIGVLVSSRRGTMQNKDHDHLGPSGGDAAHAAVRSLLSAIPVAGGAAVELFSAIVTPPIERRRREWMRNVGEALAELQSKVHTVDVARLSENEEFVTLLIAATQLAIKNHAAEKIDALRNAVLNSACGHNADEDLQEMLLSLVDQFTPLHIRLLKTFHDGFLWSNEHYPVPDEHELPPFLVPSIGSYDIFRETDRTLLTIVLRDLVQNGLIQHWIIKEVTQRLPDGTFRCTVEQWKARSTSEMHVARGVAMSVHMRPGSYVTRTTHIGGRLVDFISKPAAMC